ncbi:hypothetical protein D3C75_1255730 [compost metagenome]
MDNAERKGRQNEILQVCDQAVRERLVTGHGEPFKLYGKQQHGEHAKHEAGNSDAKQ